MIAILILVLAIIVILAIFGRDVDEFLSFFGISTDKIKQNKQIQDVHDLISSKLYPESKSQSNCDSSYPDVCIATYPPDLDCGDIPYVNFRVIGSDPHGFDRDRDGIGCEK